MRQITHATHGISGAIALVDTVHRIITNTHNRTHRHDRTPNHSPSADPSRDRAISLQGGAVMAYHRFRGDDDEEYGSFLVFYSTDYTHDESGWYWCPCFPGCMPDGEASGPFPCEADAIADAQGSS